MNSAERSHDSQRALIQTSILPAGLQPSGNLVVSPQSKVSLSKALHKENVYVEKPKPDYYSSREYSNEDILFSQSKAPPERLDKENSLGPLQLSIELENLDMNDHDSNDQKQTFMREQVTGIFEPLAIDNAKPIRNVRFLNTNNTEHVNDVS